VGPNGDIILPQVWETVIEPDWAITMHMWPIPEKPKEEPAPEPAPEKPADPPAEVKKKADGKIAGFHPPRYMLTFCFQRPRNQRRKAQRCREALRCGCSAAPIDEVEKGDLRLKRRPRLQLQHPHHEALPLMVFLL
jgi:hypothetical protein